MKAIIIILITTMVSFAYAKTTTRCVKNLDGSVTCTTTNNSGF